jgi:hypothetical protein
LPEDGWKPAGEEVAVKARRDTISEVGIWKKGKVRKIKGIALD